MSFRCIISLSKACTFAFYILLLMYPSLIWIGDSSINAASNRHNSLQRQSSRRSSLQRQESRRTSVQRQESRRSSLDRRESVPMRKSLTELLDASTAALPLVGWDDHSDSSSLISSNSRKIDTSSRSHLSAALSIGQIAADGGFFCDEW